MDEKPADRSGSAAEVLVGAEEGDVRVIPVQIERHGPDRVRQVPGDQDPSRVRRRRQPADRQQLARAVEHAWQHREGDVVAKGLHDVLHRQGAPVAAGDEPQALLRPKPMLFEVARHRVEVAGKGERVGDQDIPSRPRPIEGLKDLVQVQGGLRGRHHLLRLGAQESRQHAAERLGEVEPGHPGALPTADAQPTPVRDGPLQMGEAAMCERAERVAVEIDHAFRQEELPPQGQERILCVHASSGLKPLFRAQAPSSRSSVSDAGSRQAAGPPAARLGDSAPSRRRPARDRLVGARPRGHAGSSGEVAAGTALRRPESRQVGILGLLEVPFLPRQFSALLAGLGLLLLALLAFLPAAPGARRTVPTGGLWRSIGPAPVYRDPYAGNESGRVTSLAAAGVSLFAGSAGGGVWVTSDGGETWRPLSDRTPDMAIGALAIQPKPEVIYAGTGENDDCGDCFFSDGILRSGDGGRSWQLLGRKVFYGHYLSSLLLDPSDPRRIFAAGDLGVEVSQDGGRTWRTALRLATTDLAWAPGSPRRLLAGVEGMGVEVSSNLGRSWHVLSGGLPRPSALVGRVALAVAPSDPGTIYVSMATLSRRCADCLMGLYVTHDGGETFRRLAGTPDFLREPGTSPPQAQGDYDQVLAVSPDNPQELFAGGVDLLVTTDGGATWTDLTQNFYLHTDQHALLFTPTDLYIGNDGGVYWLTPQNTVQDLNTNLSITEVYPAMAVSSKGNRVLAGFQDNGTAVYDRRTGRWTSLFGGDGGYNAFGSGKLLLGEADGSLQRSRSGGRHWGSPQPPVGSLGVGAFAVDPKRTNILLAGGQQIWRSTRDGGSWRRVTHVGGGGPVTVIAFAPGSRFIAYAGWQNGQVALSENAGLTWRLISPPHWPTGCGGGPALAADLYVTDIAAAPDDPYRAFVSVAFGMPQSVPDCPFVFETPAANAPWPRWTDVSGDLPQFSVLGLYAAANGIVAATGDGVYWSPSRGARWLPFGRALPDVQTTTLTRAPSGGLLLGTYGRGVWELPAVRHPAVPARRRTRQTGRGLQGLGNAAAKSLKQAGR